MFQKLILALLSLLLSPAALAVSESCSPIKIDKWIKADYATAGNKFISHGITYKLIGVYAPLRQKKQKFFQKGEPMAKESQLALNKIFANHQLQVGLEYDKVKVDKFLRVPVHAYVKQKGRLISVQRLLLETGLGLVYPEAENTQHAKCYFEAEAKARKQDRGLWGFAKQFPNAHFPIVKTSEITLDDMGFHLYQGKVQKVMKTRHNYIINFDTTGARIQKKNWHRFRYTDLKKLQGQQVEIRGFGFLYRKAMYVLVETPNAIDKLNPLHSNSPPRHRR